MEHSVVCHQMTPEEKRLRILISAFDCKPHEGSEQGNGWNWVMQAARHHDVWVLSTWESKDTVMEARDTWSHLNIKFVFWRVPFWPNFLIEPLGRFLRLYYFFWQLTVLFPAVRLNRRVGFDVVHYVTFGTVEVPGFLWLLSPPFVWGPVGGGQFPPRTFRRHFGHQWIGEEIRILRKLLVPLNPIVRLAIRKASLILVANAETEKLLKRSGARNLRRESDVGVSTRDFMAKAPRDSTEPMILLWAGALVRGKGPFLALEVVADARKRGVPVELRVAGDGPLRSELDAFIKRFGLQESVHLVGKLDYHDMSAFYGSGDVFFFTSLRDTAGTVVVEAMAHGLPVITLDHHGARDMVNHHSGIKIPVTSEDETRKRLVDAIELLHTDPETRQRLSRNARSRAAQHFDWDLRSEKLREVYALVASGAAQRCT